MYSSFISILFSCIPVFKKTNRLQINNNRNGSIIKSIKYIYFPVSYWKEPTETLRHNHILILSCCFEHLHKHDIYKFGDIYASIYIFGHLLCEMIVEHGFYAHKMLLGCGFVKKHENWSTIENFTSVFIAFSFHCVNRKDFRKNLNFFLPIFGKCSPEDFSIYCKYQMNVWEGKWCINSQPFWNASRIKKKKHSKV